MGASGLEEPILQILAPIFLCLSSSSQLFPFSPFTNTHTCVCTCMCIHTRKHTQAHARTRVQCAHARAHMQTRMHTRVHTCMCTCTHAHIHMQTHVQTRTHVHTCMHTHMQTHALTHAHANTHTFQSSKEVCCVSELGLGQKRKAISPIPSMESLTLKGEGKKGWITGESFLRPHRPSLL